MIASSSDVAEERKIIREIIANWNDIHSESNKKVLLATGWDTHSTPGMEGTAQEIINEQVLSKADILVGVFWTRLGTETKDFDSGTVEEIERHIEAGKPAMVYFSDKAVKPSEIDQEQYQNVLDFKQSLQSRGKYETYTDEADFRKKFDKHLQKKILTLPGFKVEEYSASTNTASNPNLSSEAISLLKEAAKDRDGIILHSRYVGGTGIKTNNREMIENGSDARLVAKWESALNDLDGFHLIEDKSGYGQIYYVTHQGYTLAETI